MRPNQRALAWCLVVPLMVAALIWPALWNGFPVVFYDTGGYLARPFEGTLLFGRSAAYGAFLALAIPFKFWPNILIQAAMITWLMALTLRTFGFGSRPALLLVLTLTLAVATPLPWFIAELMPDIFAPAAVLALYLLAYQLPALRTWEIIPLAIVVAFAMVSHASILLLAAGLMTALAALRLVPWLRLAPPRLLAPAIAVALGILSAPLSNLVIAKQFAFTPGGETFVFNKLVYEGIVSRYLADKCPDPAIKLCEFRSEMPAAGRDDWLWGDSPLNKDLGGPAAYADEAAAIVWDTLKLYPGHLFVSAMKGASEQFVSLKAIDHLAPSPEYTSEVLQQFAPGAYEAFAAARQQRGDLNLAWLDAAYAAVAGLAVVALVILVLAQARRRDVSHSQLALLVLLALMGNAVICGTFSIPADRYQSRLAPLAVLVFLIAALNTRRKANFAPTPASF